MAPVVAPAPLGYHAMRLRWCRRALLDFLRRWGVYLLVAAAVIGAGTAGAGGIITALAAWLVLPLFWASGHGAWLLLAWPLQALAGAAAVWGGRSLLWPAGWAECERALPIRRMQVLRSDAIIVAVALAPLLLLYAVGAATLLGHDAAWLRPTRVRAVLALVLSAATSLGLGVVLLQRLRRPPRPARLGRLRRPRRAGPARARDGRTAAPLRALRWPRALLWLPLCRGKAPRTAHAMAWGAAALGGLACAPMLWPAAAAWALAGFAALALLVVTRSSTLAREELDPLLQACAPLPLAPRRLGRARACLAVTPIVPALCLLGLALLALGLPRAGLRPGVAVTYLMACLGSGAVEAGSPPAAAADKAARWLFSLVLCICLATEVWQ